MLKTKIILFLALAISFTLLIAQGTSSAGVLFEDNFDAENGGVGALNFNSFSKWNVTGGTVDLIGNGYFDFYPGNGLYVDLDGSTSDAGILSTKDSFTFLADTEYRLEFDLGGNARNAFDDVVAVSVHWLEDYEYTIPGNAPLTTFFLEFSASDVYVTPIVFSNGGGDNVGAILDNVRLSQVQVPEPTITLMLGFGLAAIAGLKRRVD